MAKEKTNLEGMTIEQLEEIKKEQMDFMQKQLKYLTVEENYTKVKAEIAENRLREYVAKVKLATAMAPPPKEQSDES
jgi:hypothetical protein